MNLSKEVIDLINKNRIAHALTNRAINVVVLDSTTSTNEHLTQLTRSSHDFQPTAVIAETMTNGKARLGRQWQAPAFCNLYLSLSWQFGPSLTQLMPLNIVVATSVYACLQKHGIDQQLALKWPNDICYNQKKLAGILLEIASNSSKNVEMVIGVGINVNMVQQENISQPWTSLKQITQHDWSRNELAASLINHLSDSLIKFEQEGIQHFIDKWQQHDPKIGEVISLISLDEKKITSGQYLGVNIHGELLLLDKNNQQHQFSSGEVSVLKNRHQ